MRKFFEDRSKAIFVSVIMLVLIILLAVAHYYLQNDQIASAWALSFGFGFLLIQSLTTLLYGIFNKKKNVSALSIEFIVLSIIWGVYFVSMLSTTVMQIIPGEPAYLVVIGIIIPAVLVFAYADNLTFGKNLITKVWYIIPALLVASALAFWANKTVTLNDDLAHKVVYAIAVVFMLIGIIMAVINLVKKRETSFSWALLLYSLAGLGMNVIRLFNRVNANKLLSVLCLGASIMLVAAVYAQGSEAITQKSNAKKKK